MTRSLFRKLQPGAKVIYLPDGMTGTVAAEGFGPFGLWIAWADGEEGPLEEKQWPMLQVLGRAS